MNTSYNYSDFIGLSLESNDDYEPYGYDMTQLQAVETVRRGRVVEDGGEQVEVGLGLRA